MTGPAYRRELEVVLDAVSTGAELLRAEVTRPGGPRGADAHADVDDEICSLLVGRLGAAFPRDEIRSEELPTRPGTSGRAFLIDPHDGTSSFLRGRRETSISVALVEDGQLVLGVVHAPLTSALTGPAGTVISWARGEPLCQDGRPLDPPPGPGELGPRSRVLLSASARKAWEERGRPGEHPQLLRCGSVATRLALVAAGAADLGVTVRGGLRDYDFAGGQALLRAAGGDLLDEWGEPIEWEGLRVAGPRRRAYFGARNLEVARRAARAYRALAGLERS